jgi:CubicO group peptidase (beta-lactamase class C family)
MKTNFLFSSIRTGVLTTFFLGCAILNIPLLAQQKEKSSSPAKASYDLSTKGTFMRTWYIAGPISTALMRGDSTEEMQRKAFEKDTPSPVKVVPGKGPSNLTIDGKEMKWTLIKSGKDYIDLDSIYGAKDFVYVYALTEITAPEAAHVILSLGSDDGIRVWHNGKLVHDNWILRGTTPDEDIVPLKLEKGNNQIILKVQDMRLGWSFAARILDKTLFADKFVPAAASGRLDQLKLLLESGADVNAKNKDGFSALQVARIKGREEVAQFLLKNGARDEPLPSEEAMLDGMYRPLKDKEIPGIAVLVARDGNVLYRKGFGYADINSKIKVTPETKFRIGSVTKQFTAAAILKLQENNKLSVNDKLSKFIPDFPRGDEVTIHHLLTHTSGIHSYTSKPGFIDKVTTTISEQDLVNSIKNDPYDFNPGEQWSYNNSGYFLLGYIIGKVSGKPYATYLKETFLDPLQMTNTGVHYAGIKLENEALGYSKDKGKYDATINWDMSWAGGAGALYSTLDDLLKWNTALYNGKILKDESLKAATTSVTLKNGEKPQQGEYGYGLGISKFRGTPVIQHGGGLHGFLTQLAWYPAEKLSVVMFTNTNDVDVNFNPNPIAELYMYKSLDKQETIKELAEKPKNLADFTGRYDFMNSAVMIISTEGDKIFGQLTGQQKFEIYPSSENEFFWKVVDARIKFIKGEDGKVTHALFYQNGQEINAKRLKEETIVKINPKLLDAYVGKYNFVNNMVVSVFKEQDKIFVQATNQPKFEMFPVSETDFVLMDLNARISFKKESDGKVKNLLLYMNGSTNELPRIE